jgi:hypothetical protein
MSKARSLEGSITNLNLHAQDLDALLIRTLSSRRYERRILAKANHTNIGPRADAGGHAFEDFYFPANHPGPCIYLLRSIECFSVARLLLGVQGGGVKNYDS